jgi:hypothetical protein
MFKPQFRFFLSCFVFLCLVSCSSFLKPKVNTKQELPPVDEASELFPLSSPEDFISCDKVFDDEANYNQALECVNNSGVLREKLNPGPKPKCWVVKTTSPDIKPALSFNYLAKLIPTLVISPDGRPDFKILTLNILGLFDPLTDNMYVVENIDQDIIYRHELQHHFLKLANVENDNSHSSDVWKKCEAATYKPSRKAKIIGWFIRFGQLFKFET